MTTPHDTESGPAGPAAPEPGDGGPRVTRDEVRDLARLRRSRTDRKVSGVAGGIARHLDVDPLLVRVAFVILTFFGGGGLILYGVAWLLVPEEDTGATVIRTEDGVRTAALIVAGVLTVASVVGDSVGGPDFPWPLLVAGLVLLVVFGSKHAKEATGTHTRGDAGSDSGSVPPPPPGTPTYSGYHPGPPPQQQRPAQPRRRGPLLFPVTAGLAALGLGILGTLHLAGADVAPSAYPATVLGVAGVMLVVGAFYGRAGGLILVGLVAATATALTSVVDQFDRTGFGETTPSIDSAAELKDHYELAAGEIVIDLSDLDASELEELEGRTLDLDLNVGEIRVIVPDSGLRVDVDGSVELGEVRLFGEKSGNSDRATHGLADEPLLRIDAHATIGEIEVSTEEDAA